MSAEMWTQLEKARNYAWAMAGHASTHNEHRPLYLLAVAALATAESVSNLCDAIAEDIRHREKK